MGKWSYEVMAKSYLMYFKPVGLLASAGWPGAAQNDYNQFWAVPQELVDLLFPFLPALQKVRCHLTVIYEFWRAHESKKLIGAKSSPVREFFSARS